MPTRAGRPCWRSASRGSGASDRSPGGGHMLDEFVRFLRRTNALARAAAVIMGAAIGQVVSPSSSLRMSTRALAACLGVLLTSPAPAQLDQLLKGLGAAQPGALYEVKVG